MSEELIARQADYRMTIVETHDYGDGPACPKRVIATFARIPDGSHWEAMPATLRISVPEGTRPGQVFTLSLRARGEA